jgi:peptidoglycan-associated lipoprotein
MTKKIWVLLTLMMVLPAMTFMASCSKKKIYSDPTGTQSSDDAARAAEKARQDALARQRAFDEQQLKDQGTGTGAGAGGKAGGGSGLDGEKSVTRSSFVSEDIYFEFDSASLIPEARDVLKRKAEFLRSNPAVSVNVEGHTDDRGTVAYNLALGERRAASAMSFLVDLGIPASRLTPISYGKEKPANSGHNETAWAANRRVHFEIKK